MFARCRIWPLACCIALLMFPADTPAQQNTTGVVLRAGVAPGYQVRSGMASPDHGLTAEVELTRRLFARRQRYSPEPPIYWASIYWSYEAEGAGSTTSGVRFYHMSGRMDLLEALQEDPLFMNYGFSIGVARHRLSIRFTTVEIGIHFEIPLASVARIRLEHRQYVSVSEIDHGVNGIRTANLAGVAFLL